MHLAAPTPRYSSAMLERFVHVVSCADGGNEDTAATRERLKDRFPRGATRRMTQLGMLIGTVLEDVHPRSEDALVYASGFAENAGDRGLSRQFSRRESDPVPNLDPSERGPAGTHRAATPRAGVFSADRAGRTSSRTRCKPPRSVPRRASCCAAVRNAARGCSSSARRAILPLRSHSRSRPFQAVRSRASL